MVVLDKPQVAREKQARENNAPSNKSMDVRAKQRLCYQRCLFNFSLRVGGFAPRHLNRYASETFLEARENMITKIFYIICLICHNKLLCLWATRQVCSFARNPSQKFDWSMFETKPVDFTGLGNRAFLT